jgi:hypothetical protein
MPVKNNNNNNKNKSSSNNATKSVRQALTVAVKESSNINGSGEQQKRLQQNPQESSLTARTAASTISTAISTATTGSSGPQQHQETDTDTSNSSDEVMAVSLWEDEEQDLVEIHLPTICESSLLSESISNSTFDKGNGNGNCKDSSKDDTQTTSPATTTYTMIGSSSSSSSILKLRQYGSTDDRWGIHSTIWDGGLALTAYLASHYYSYYTGTGSNDAGTINNAKNMNGRDHGGGITEEESP